MRWLSARSSGRSSAFPIDKFADIQQAFPCIIAGLRDYAEFIPLEREIFDLVIIDEASQVSIAQALPAIIRAKKVLVLGDRQPVRQREDLDRLPGGQWRLHAGPDQVFTEDLPMPATR